MKSILQKLYDSEINARVSTFWDRGFRVELGDELNGILASDEFHTYEEAMDWLDCVARQHYPESDYAKGAAG